LSDVKLLRQLARLAASNCPKQEIAAIRDPVLEYYRRQSSALLCPRRKSGMMASPLVPVRHAQCHGISLSSALNASDLLLHTMACSECMVEDVAAPWSITSPPKRPTRCCRFAGIERSFGVREGAQGRDPRRSFVGKYRRNILPWYVQRICKTTRVNVLTRLLSFPNAGSVTYLVFRRQIIILLAPAVCRTRRGLPYFVRTSGPVSGNAAFSTTSFLAATLHNRGDAFASLF